MRTNHPLGELSVSSRNEVLRRKRDAELRRNPMPMEEAKAVAHLKKGIEEFRKLCAEAEAKFRRNCR